MPASDTSVPDLVVVVRAAGERTAECCRALLLREVPERAVHVIDERPFEAALRRCYQIGIDSGAEWMLTVDGDVLARPGAVRDLVAVARQLPAEYAQVEGLVHDKVMDGYRHAGHRVYRTKYLAKALVSVPADGAEVRPESATLRRLAQLGHPSQLCRTVFGIHDYEQYHADLYRKCFVHGVKHPQWLGALVPHWKMRSANDADFHTVIRAFFDGYQARSGARIDTRAYHDRAIRALADLGIAEKSALPAHRDNLAAIDALIAEHMATELATGRVTMGSKISRSFRNLRRRGLTLETIGQILTSWGERIRSAARG